MRKIICCAYFLLAVNFCIAAPVFYELYPNIHTIGITVLFDAPVPPDAIAEIYYESFDNGNWSLPKQGLSLARVTNKQFAGCIFWTKPGTLYRVRTVVSSSGSLLMDTVQTVTTRSEPENKPVLRTFYVSPSGTGISQSISAPGSLSQALLDLLAPGDKVALLAGTYYTGELEIKSSGTEEHPIVFEGIGEVTLDGSIATPIQWTRFTTDTAHRDYNLFYANLGALNTNCVIADGRRLYPYRNLLELSLFQTIRVIDANGFPSGNFPIGLSGFFRDGRHPTANHFPYVGYNPNTYIKFADGTDTTGKDIRVSKQSFCFRASGQSNIHFVNIIFRHYGAAKLSNHRCALLLNDCDSLLIDRCRFEFCDRGIVFTGNSDANIIQYSAFQDDFGAWSYFQFKETNEDYGQFNIYFPNYFPYSYRNVEPGRVYFDRSFTGRGNLIRYNLFSGGCDGITCPETPGDSTTGRHFDIYGNEFMLGADDAFEVDGNASNIRIWGNVIHNVGGISAASPCYGPIYIFRNIIYDLPVIHFEYIYFGAGGYQLHSEPVSASPLKLNGSYCDIPGTVYFMHNTCDVGASGRGFYLHQPQPQSNWANVIARNNIFYLESAEHALWVRATDKVDLDYNNYYSTQGFTARKDRNGFGIYHSLADASQNILGDLNDPTSFIETHGYELDPAQGWRNKAARDYRLLPASPMLDKGIHIPGVNDGYSGAAPDLGAFELVMVFDTVIVSDVVETTDTTVTRDTVFIYMSGIADTTIISTSEVACDSLWMNGAIASETDTFFSDTLFINVTYSQTDTLSVVCEETVVDSVFLPAATSAHPLRHSEVKIYPNPSDGNFVVIFSSVPAREAEITLTDFSGKIIYRQLFKEGEKILSINCHPPPPSGIYLLHVKSQMTLAKKTVAIVD